MTYIVDKWSETHSFIMSEADAPLNRFFKNAASARRIEYFIPLCTCRLPMIPTKKAFPVGNFSKHECGKRQTTFLSVSSTNNIEPIHNIYYSNIRVCHYTVASLVCRVVEYSKLMSSALLLCLFIIVLYTSDTWTYFSVRCSSTYIIILCT